MSNNLYGYNCQSSSSKRARSFPSNNNDEDEQNDISTSDQNNLTTFSTKKPSNYLPSKPYSSIKQLNLSSQSTNFGRDLLMSNVVSSKRLRLNNNGDDRGTGSLSLFDSIPKTNDLNQRPSSRLSFSTMSSTSTTPDLYKNSKYLFSSRRSIQPCHFESKETKDLNSSFYLGKTTFGGANLRKNVHRLSTTPYSLSNVRCVEAKQSNSKNSTSVLNEDVRLSSVTQRILERLEKAATPIQDAKKRLISGRSQSSSLDRPLSRSSSLLKLFDTSSPSALYNGRCNVDFNHKPLKYILTSAPENNTEERADSVKSGNKDIDKLAEIRQAEQKLERQLAEKQANTFQPRKDLSCGKITHRDVKKGRKLGDNEEDSDDDQEHLNVLSNTKPISFSAPLKSFKLSSITESNDSSVTQDNQKHDNNSLFNFPSPTIATSNKLTSTKCTLNFDFSSPTTLSNCTSKLSPPQLTDSLNTKSQDLILNQNNESSKKFEDLNSVDGACFSKKSSDDKNGSLFDLPKSQPSLLEQFVQKKNKANIWTCLTCCIENDFSDNKCVACEEPNPNNKSTEQSTKPSVPVPEFKFGTASLSKPSSNVEPLNQLIKKSTKQEWSCPVCMVSNDLSESKCVSCEEPNPNKKLSDQSTKPFVSTLPEFKFAAGSLSKPLSNVEPLNQLFKKSTKQEWSCPVCMISNEISASSCVSCEEPNPNKKSENLFSSGTLPTSQFKFGSYSTSVNSLSKSTPDSWTCFYCKATNNAGDSQSCNECHKVKTLAATKEEVHKFYDNQTFKFGFNKPTLAISSNFANSSIPTTTVKFGAPTTTESRLICQNETKKSESTEKPTFSFSSGASKTLLSESNPDKSSSTIVSKEPVKITLELKQPADNKVLSNSVAVSSTSTVNAIVTSASSSNNLFQFGSTKPDMFKFEAPASTLKTVSGDNTLPVTTATTVSSSSLFSFGATAFTSNKTLPTLTSSTSKSNLSESQSELKSLTSAPVSVPKIVFGAASTVSSSLNPPTTGSLFSFGSANVNTNAGLTNDKPSFSFNASNTTATSSTATTAAATSLFKFGSTSNSLASTTTATTNNTTSSKFTFGSASSGLNFGSPVSFNINNVGSPLQTPKINLNYPETNNDFKSANAVPSLFSFGTSSASSVPSTTASSLFSFGSTAAAPATTTATLPNAQKFAPNIEFGSPISFNMNAGPPVPTQKISLNYPSTNSFAPNPVPAISPFTFGSQSSQTPSQSAASSLPSFAAPQSNTATFNFSAQPNLNFQSFSGNSAENSAVAPPSTGSVFQFSADQSQAVANPSARHIKKAKRRLK